MKENKINGIYIIPQVFEKNTNTQISLPQPIVAGESKEWKFRIIRSINRLFLTLDELNLFINSPELPPCPKNRVFARKATFSRSIGCLKSTIFWLGKEKPGFLPKGSNLG